MYIYGTAVPLKMATRPLLSRVLSRLNLIGGLLVLSDLQRLFRCFQPIKSSIALLCKPIKVHGLGGSLNLFLRLRIKMDDYRL